MQKFMIMDYSLLLIVEENPHWTKEQRLKRKNTIKGNDDCYESLLLGANLGMKRNTLKTVTQSKKASF